MKKIINSIPPLKNLSYKSAGIFILFTILLGAIGSGLWDRFFSKCFDSISYSLLKLLSRLFKGYINSLYSNIGMFDVNTFSAFNSQILFVFVLAAYWLYFIYVIISISPQVEELQNNLNKYEHDQDDLESKDEPKELFVERMKRGLLELKRKYRFLFTFALSCAIIASAIYGSSFFEAYFSKKATLFIDSSIEILAPYISNEKHLQLRAEFRSIHTAEDFYKLEDKLRDLASKYNVALLDFKSIR